MISAAQFAHVCGHLVASARYSAQNRFRKKLTCKLSHASKEEPPRYSCQKDLLSCDYCPSEVCIAVKRFPDWMALVVTKWVRIGPGQDRSDGRWSIRLRQAELDRLKLERKLCIALPCILLRLLHRHSEIVILDLETMSSCTSMEVSGFYSTQAI